MKAVFSFIRYILPCLLFMAFWSCDDLKDDKPLKDEKTEIVLNSETEFSVDPNGESMILGFSSTASWHLVLDISSSDAWISVNKNSGQKGSASVMLTALPNYSGQVRYATITITAGDVSEIVSFTQETVPEADVPSFKILSENAVISHKGGIVEVKLISSIHYDLKVTDEWVREVETKTSGQQINHFFEVDANAGWTERVAHLAFCTDQLCIPYTITQEADPDAVEPEDPADKQWAGKIEEGWEDKEFLHHPVAMRFTADWCGYCPMMATALDEAKETLGGNLEVLSMHCSGGLEYSPLTKLESQYRIGGYPTGIIDGMTEVGNYSSTSYTASVAVEAVRYTESNFSTMTTVGWISQLKDRKLKTSLSVYLKEPGTYKVTVLAVEDNIRAYQSGAGSNYQHNGVPRHAFSSISGDEYVASSANEVAQLVYSGKIPEACNLENMRLVVYVQRSMGDKSGLASRNYGGYFIDNSATAKLGESHDIEFAPASGTESVNHD